MDAFLAARGTLACPSCLRPWEERNLPGFVGRREPCRLAASNQSAIRAATSPGLTATGSSAASQVAPATTTLSSIQSPARSLRLRGHGSFPYPEHPSMPPAAISPGLPLWAPLSVGIPNGYRPVGHCRLPPHRAKPRLPAPTPHAPLASLFTRRTRRSASIEPPPSSASTRAPPISCLNGSVLMASSGSAAPMVPSISPFPLHLDP